jgi:hypothetical protein
VSNEGFHRGTATANRSGLRERTSGAGGPQHDTGAIPGSVNRAVRVRSHRLQSHTNAPARVVGIKEENR